MDFDSVFLLTFCSHDLAVKAYQQVESLSKKISSVTKYLHYAMRYPDAKLRDHGPFLERIYSIEGKQRKQRKGEGKEKRKGGKRANQAASVMEGRMWL